MTEEDSILASEYALGMLGIGDRSDVEARMAHDAEFADHIDWWIKCFLPLTQDSDKVDPPAELLGQIEDRIEQQSISGCGRSLTIREGEGNWIEIAPGARKKFLYFDEKSSSEAFLLDLEAGANLPEHEHKGTEDCLVISGDFNIGNLKLNAGDFHAAFIASRHMPCRSENGCRLFIKSTA